MVFVDRFFITIQLITAIFTLIMVSIIVHKGAYFYVVLMISIILSASYKMFVFNYPESLIGQDPDSFATYAHLTILTGDASIPYLSFYSEAPLYHVLIGIVSLVSRLSLPNSVGIFPLLSGILPPIIAGVITYKISKSTTAANLSVLITAILPITTLRAYWPIPQTLATLLFMILLYLLLKDTTGKKRYLVLTILLFISIIYTHKLPGLPILMIFTLVLIDEWRTGRAVRIDAKFTTVLLLGILLLGQWIYATDFIGKPISFLQTLIISDRNFLSETSAGHPPFAGIPDPGWLSIFQSHSASLLLLTTAGIAWIILYANWENHAERKLLVATSILAGLTVISGFRAGDVDFIQPLRSFFLAEVFLIVLISISTAILIKKYRIKKIISVFVSVLLVFQIFSVAASPAFPGTPKYYLDSGETNAKQFGNQYVETTIYTDTYYASETVDFERIDTKDHPAVLPSWVTSERKYREYDPHHLDGTLSQQGYLYILHRANVDVFLVGGRAGWARSSYTIDWDAKGQLDSEYNRVYTNDDVHLYYERK